MPITKRNNRDDYLAYGFTTIIEKGKVMPQCVLCGRVFSAFSLKPSKMIRHMECRHQDVKDKPMSYFAEMRDKVLAQGPSEMYTPRTSYNNNNNNNNNNCIANITVNSPSSAAPFAISPRVVPSSSTPIVRNVVNNPAQQAKLLAAYKISLKIAQSKCRHVMGEELILPSIIDACSVILGEESTKKIQKLDLSESTVDRQIVDMSCDVKEQVIEAINRSVLYALQIDDTTDVTKGEHLMVYVRFLCEQTIEEDFLFCEPLSFEVSSEDIFEKLDQFFANEGLNWLNCVAISTSGSPAMRDLQAMAKSKNQNILVMHSFLNKQIFTSYALGVDFGATLEDIVDMVSFIKNQGFENAIYEQLRDSLDEDSRHLFVSSNTRWLCVQILDKMHELREDILDYFEDNKNQLGERLKDFHWLTRFCFIRDIFDHAEEMLRTLSLVESNSNIIEISETICKFKLQVNGWAENFSVDHDQSWSQAFPRLFEIVQVLEKETSFQKKSLLSSCKEHLEKLQKELNEYMIDPRRNTWIRNPLTVNILDVPEQSIGMKLDLLDMRGKNATEIELELKDPNTTLLQFWIKRLNSYPSASLEALRILLAFPTQELSEAGFQALTDLAPGERLRPNIDHDLRLTLSSRMPRFARLVKSSDLVSNSPTEKYMTLDEKKDCDQLTNNSSLATTPTTTSNINNNNNNNGIGVYEGNFAGARKIEVKGFLKRDVLESFGASNLPGTVTTCSTTTLLNVKPITISAGHALPIKLPRIESVTSGTPITATSATLTPVVITSPQALSMNMPVFQS